MLLVGSPKIAVLSKELYNREIEGIQFDVVSKEGLTLKLKHNAESDQFAKDILKKYIKSLKDYGNVYTNIQLIDDDGRIY